MVSAPYAQIIFLCVIIGFPWGVGCLPNAKDWFIALLEGVARFEHSLHGVHVLPGQYCTEPSRPLAHKDKVVWLLSGRQLAKWGEDRLSIAKTLIGYNYDKDRITNFLIFLKNFLYINNSKINSKFDQEIIQLTGGSVDMSVIEIVKKQERQQGRQQGRLEERAKAEAEKLAEKLKSALKFKNMGIPVKDIAEGLGLTVEQVEKLK